MKNNKSKTKQGILLAFGEIFLKSPGVQQELKNKIKQNIILLLKKEGVIFQIYFLRERIFIETKNVNKALKILKNIFGIAWMSKTLFLENANLKNVNDFIKKNYKKWIKNNQTFALYVKKSSEIQESRENIINKIAENIKRKVNLSKPNKKIFIEARKNGWFLYFKKQKCLDGLPIGSQGKIISLISGGIDSPISSYLIAKRGAENIWLHFHSFPMVSKASIEKIKELAKIFTNYQPRLKIYFIPFSEIQTKLKIKIPSKYLVLFYRKIMLQIAEMIAKKEKC
ncbi:MAG: THUMP domain-containing protein, partial [Patescibacteria group bacterium]